MLCCQHLRLRQSSSGARGALIEGACGGIPATEVFSSGRCSGEGQRVPLRRRGSNVMDTQIADWRGSCRPLSLAAVSPWRRCSKSHPGQHLWCVEIAAIEARGSRHERHLPLAFPCLSLVITSVSMDRSGCAPAASHARSATMSQIVRHVERLGRPVASLCSCCWDQRE